MYCGACARDVALVRGLTRRGHDVAVLPLYTPLRSDSEEELQAERVFLGGINAYLQQVSPLFRHTPAWLDAWLDSPALLRWASRFAVSVKPEELGPMTVSVLQGSAGRQRKELQKILAFLEAGGPWDVVSVTNSMLSGIAPELKERLRAPVVCLLQGEESFIAELLEPYRTQARELMRRNARVIDAFVAPGEGYAAAMAEWLGVPRDRVVTIRAGIDPEGYANPQSVVREPFTVGYLSVIHARKGLDLLVEAWSRLVLEQGRDVRLLVAGKVMDRAYWKRIMAATSRPELRRAFEFLGEVDRRGKIEMLHRCSVFCVPSRIAESRGVATMEAQAAGVPVVVPNAGVYPEMLALTGGGLLHEPDSVRSIAERLAQIMDDAAAARAMSQAASKGIANHFGADTMVEKTLALFEQLAGEQGGRPGR